MNRAKFYDALRPHINLTTSNVSGTERILNYGMQRGSQVNDMAYILATAWWETGQTMQPVKEAYWMSESWRKKNLRYFPWYGRGLIQTTWERNYKVMGDIIGVDLTRNPNLLLKWDHALPALFVGMERGIYTGVSLSDKIDDIDESDSEDFREYLEARRIVNGTDKARTIADLALRFEHALHDGGWLGAKPIPTTPTIPRTKEPVGWIALIGLIGAGIAFFWDKIKPVAEGLLP